VYVSATSRSPGRWEVRTVLRDRAGGMAWGCGMSEIVVAMSPVAVSPADAARALGVSLTFFSEEIQPELRLVRRK
jgi:hypothetical protein